MKISREERKSTARELIQFLEKSPTCFHAVKNLAKELEAAGFEELKENEVWNLSEHKNYYVTRNQSSIIAFRLPSREFKGYQIMASHSDSPTFKIKENPEMEAEKQDQGKSGDGGRKEVY